MRQHTAAPEALNHGSIGGVHYCTICQTLQHTVIRYTTLRHAATRCNTLQHLKRWIMAVSLECTTAYSATLYKILQHTAARYTMLQHSAAPEALHHGSITGVHYCTLTPPSSCF